MASKAIGFLTFKFGANLGGFEKALKKSQRSLKKFGKSMKKVGRNMTTNLTMPIVGIGAVAIKTFAGFEQAMLKVKAISGATGEQFKMLEADAKRLGSSTMFTASQVAELQLNLSKLGLTPEEINKSTESILALAQATDSDLAQSATVAAATMKGFGLQASDMNMITDVMADSFSSTALDMEKFQVSMASVAPVANQAGATLQETTAVLGTLMNRGVEASTAGTALRNIFLDLADKGLTWEEAMRKVTSSANPLATSMELFGKRGATVATIIANNRQEITGLTKDFIDSEGEASSMAKIMDSGIGGALRKMQSQLEGVAITLGEILIPVFQKVLNFVDKMLKGWQNLDSGTKQTIVTIGLLVAGIGPMITLIGSLSVAFAALSSPVGIAVAAIVGLVVAFAYVSENWEALKERLGDWNWWRNSLIQALQWFIDFNPMALILEGFNHILDFFGQNKIPDPFNAMIDGLENLKVETKEYENEFGSFADAMINSSKKVAKAFGLMGNPLGLGGGTAEPKKKDEKKDGGLIKLNVDTRGPIEAIDSVSDEILNSTEETTKSMAETWTHFWQDWGYAIQDGVNKAKTVMASLGELAGSIAKKETIAFENEKSKQNDILDADYERQLARIENSLMDEEAKNAAIEELDAAFATKKEALDEKMAKKEKEIKIKQAKREKAMGIVNATISGVEAVMAAVAASPLTGGLPWSAIVAGLAAANVATIASTPIPAFADGGIVSGPTVGLMGEYPGANTNPEVIAPLDKLKNMIDGGKQSVEVTGRISGNDILLISQKAQFDRNRFV